MTATHWVLIVLTALILGFDIVLACTDSLPTISQVVWEWIKIHPVLPFAVGVVCGHLFW